MTKHCATNVGVLLFIALLSKVYCVALEFGAMLVAYCRLSWRVTVLVMQIWQVYARK